MVLSDTSSILATVVILKYFWQTSHSKWWFLLVIAPKLHPVNFFSVVFIYLSPLQLGLSKPMAIDFFGFDPRFMLKLILQTWGFLTVDDFSKAS